jgi:hypothetical protein
MEVGTMALSLWSKRSLVVLASICAIAGFLIGSSSSQDVRRGAAEEEVGRYRMLSDSRGGFIVFDTKTARSWFTQVLIDEKGKRVFDPDRWQSVGSPFEKEKR